MSDPSRRWISATRSGVKRSRRTVVHRPERHPVVVDRDQRVAQREDLEAAGVGEDRPVPAGERVQAAELLDQLVAGPEMEVVRVSEHDRGTERSHLVRVERLDRAFRTDRHERRRRDVAVGRTQDACPRRSVRRSQLKALHGGSA